MIIFQIYTLYKSSKAGIEICAPPEQDTDNESKLKQIVKKAKLLKEKYESKHINCRKCAYRKHDTDQKTAVEFIYSSFIILQLLSLLEDSPTILLNIFTGDISLQFTGWFMLFSDICMWFIYIYTVYAHSRKYIFTIIQAIYYQRYMLNIGVVVIYSEPDVVGMMVVAVILVVDVLVVIVYVISISHLIIDHMSSVLHKLWIGVI